MDINYYKKYEPIFGVWYITNELGSGSFGRVFELEREDFGTVYKAALKAITVPANESELADVMADNTTEDGVRTYYDKLVQELASEFDLMSKLKGNSNIVSYENHLAIPHENGVGWDILIQMELLTPLSTYTKSHSLTRDEVLRLGIDLCKALELCQKQNIIHRDIKPENIFLSPAGDFKLGDFGIARTAEKTSSGMSRKGTYNYMAPEVYKNEPYGRTVDIYSLGIVLYRYLNGGRLPFLSGDSNVSIGPQDREDALNKRLSGAPLPEPAYADDQLAKIVLKACDFEPKNRFGSPAQLRTVLEMVRDGRELPKELFERPEPETREDEDEDERKTARNVGKQHAGLSSDNDKTYVDHKKKDKEVAPPQKSSRNNKLLLAAAACVLILCVAGGGYMILKQRNAEQVAAQTQAVQAEAYNLYQERQFSQCVEYTAEQLAGSYKGNEALTAILASAKFELGEYEEAAELYRQLSEAADYEMKIETLRDYAVCLARIGRTDEAAAVFVMLTDQGADADITDYVLGETYYAKQDYENAADAFSKVLTETKNDVLLRRSYSSLAETYREAGDYSTAIEILEQALKKAELMSDPVLYEMLGMAYYQRSVQNDSANDRMKAAQAFDRAIQLGVQKEYMYINAAFCYFDADATSRQRAFELLDEMEQLYPQSCQAHAVRGLLYIVQEGEKDTEARDYTAAMQEYQSAKRLIIDSDNQSYFVQLQTYIEDLQQKGWL